MMVENTLKVQGIHKKRRVEREWHIMTIDNKKHHLMHKNSRIELKCATMTVEKESNVCVMHRKSRMELRYLILAAVTLAFFLVV